MRRHYSSDGGWGLWLWLVIAAALVWIGFEAFSSWQSRHISPAQIAPSAATRQSPAQPSLTQSAQEHSGSALPAPSKAPSAQVYRCGNAYSDQPCTGAKLVSTAPSYSDSTGPQTKEIYLCESTSGNRYWQSEHCSVSNQSTLRIARVPSNISWDAQVATARQQRDKAEAIASEQIVASAVRTQQQTSPSNTGECQALEARVNWLDALGRAGGSGYTMDWIRAERKIARDRQFRLKC